MLSNHRLSAPFLPLLLLGILVPVFAPAQTLVVNLTFDSGDFTQIGAASTTFALSRGSVTFAPGIRDGLAAVFDGNSSLQASDSPLTSGLTVAFWMKTTTDNGLVGAQWYHGAGLVDGEIGGVTTDWGVSQVGTRIAFGTGSPDATIFSTSNVNTGEWIHVAATWDTSGSMNLYLNGLRESSYALASLDARRTTNPFFVGMDANGSAYTGSLDEIQIYDGLLSDSQIADLANVSSVPEPSTVGLLGLGALVLGVARWRRSRR